MDVLDDAKTGWNVHVVLRGPDGEIKEERRVHNLITTAGLNGIMEQLQPTPDVAKPSHMAIGTGTTAAAAGDTALQTELDRNALNSPTVATAGAVATMVGSWGQGDGTGAITEAGILNNSSGGTLFSRAVFSVINKGANDTLDITWTYTLAAS